MSKHPLQHYTKVKVKKHGLNRGIKGDMLAWREWRSWLVLLLQTTQVTGSILASRIVGPSRGCTFHVEMARMGVHLKTLGFYSPVTL